MVNLKAIYTTGFLSAKLNTLKIAGKDHFAGGNPFFYFIFLEKPKFDLKTKDYNLGRDPDIFQDLEQNPAYSQSSEYGGILPEF